jgi:hypothetical protein
LEHFLATIHSSEQTYTDLRNIHNARYPTDPLLSYDQIKRRVAQWSGVVPIVHHMCPQSCAAYTGPYDQLEVCPECNQSRYDQFRLQTSQGKVKVPVQTFYTIPLGPQIQAMWRNPTTAKKLMYRRTATKEILDRLVANGGNIETFDDLLHGSEYLEACARGDIGPEDTVIMCSIDGAQLYQDKDSDCWILIWIFLEFAPEFRYKKLHVMPGAFVPGPKKPK